MKIFNLISRWIYSKYVPGPAVAPNSVTILDSLNEKQLLAEVCYLCTTVGIQSLRQAFSYWIKHVFIVIHDSESPQALLLQTRHMPLLQIRHRNMPNAQSEVYWVGIFRMEKFCNSFNPWPKSFCRYYQMLY